MARGTDAGISLVGYGDNLMATGMARGAAKRGKRIAFGDGKRIIWDHHSEMIFQGNQNIARPGLEGKADLEWIPFHRGHRIYNSQGNNCWVWNYDFHATPGELFLTSQERIFGDTVRKGFVLVEPNVPAWKAVAPNKQWPIDRYEAVSRKLRSDGHRVVQLWYGKGHKLASAEFITAATFRHALAVMARAALYIGPEGGLHHGAAAFNIPGVVLFGGFIPPAVTGYATHTNLTGGAMACGSFGKCAHCKAAMDAISVDEVLSNALNRLRAKA